MKQARYKNKLGKYNPKTDSIIISVKEARRILGKEMSDKLSDEDLARMIGLTKKSQMVTPAGVSPLGYPPSAGEPASRVQFPGKNYQIEIK